MPLSIIFSSTAKSPLVQWSETLGHPGCICAVNCSTSTPIIIAIKPDAITIQELKPLPPKVKVQGLTLVRLTKAVELVSIVLCFVFTFIFRIQ